MGICFVYIGYWDLMRIPNCIWSIQKARNIDGSSIPGRLYSIEEMEHIHYLKKESQAQKDTHTKDRQWDQYS